MEVKPGYKQTEVGVIPEDWSVVNIQEHAAIKTGKRNTQDRVPDGQYPFFVRSQVVERINSYSFDGEAVLTAGDGVGTGKVFHYINGRFDFHQRVYRISDFSAELNGFFFFLVFSTRFYDRIMSMTAKSSVDSVRLEMIADMQIPLPPTVEEQRAIAGALSDVDALIGAQDRLIAKKRELKQAAMQQLLTGQTRLPGFHGEWEVKTLGDVATLYQPVTISAKLFTEAGFPVYGANGVVGFYHDFNHDCWQVTVTCRGSTCGTVNRTVEKCWITGNAMVVNCDQNEDLSKNFLYYVLLSQDLSVCITGTGQPQIVRGPLANVELSIPRDVAEQTAIAEVLSDMDAELAALTQRRDKTRALKQGMMQELLTGRIRLV